MAESAVSVIDEVLKGDMEAVLVSEKGAAPHAKFALIVEIHFGARACTRGPHRVEPVDNFPRAPSISHVRLGCLSGLREHPSNLIWIMPA